MPVSAVMVTLTASSIQLGIKRSERSLTSAPDFPIGKITEPWRLHEFLLDTYAAQHLS